MTVHLSSSKVYRHDPLQHPRKSCKSSEYATSCVLVPGCPLSTKTGPLHRCAFGRALRKPSTLIPSPTPAGNPGTRTRPPGFASAEGPGAGRASVDCAAGPRHWPDASAARGRCQHVRPRNPPPAVQDVEPGPEIAPGDAGAGADNNYGVEQLRNHVPRAGAAIERPRRPVSAAHLWMSSHRSSRSPRGSEPWRGCGRQLRS